MAVRFTVRPGDRDVCHRRHLHPGARPYHQHLQPDPLGIADIDLYLFCTSQHRLHLCQFFRLCVLQGTVQAVRVTDHLCRHHYRRGGILFPGNRDGAHRADVLLPAFAQPQVSHVLDGGLVYLLRHCHYVGIHKYPDEQAFQHGHVGGILHCDHYPQHPGQSAGVGQFARVLLQRADADLLSVHRLSDRLLTHDDHCRCDSQTTETGRGFTIWSRL